MLPQPPEYYFNADFDTGLGLNVPVPNQVSEYVRELALHYIFAAPSNGSMVIHPQITSEFYRYMEKIELPVPHIINYPDFTPDSLFVPFGWDHNMMEMGRKYTCNIEETYPDLEIVKKVNSKVFSHDLASELGEQEGGGVFDNLITIKAFFKKNPEGNWLCKSEHGNSGSGHRLIKPGDGSPLKWARKVLETGQCIIIERLRHRYMDISLKFTVSRNGEINGIRMWEVLNGVSGGFEGIITDLRDDIRNDFGNDLYDTAVSTGKSLFKEGYFGPVCIDSFIWLDEAGRKHLRKLVEINARLNMSMPAHSIHDYLGDDKIVKWKFYKSEKLNKKSAISGMAGQTLGDEGVIITSPLTALKNRSEKALRKISVLFYGRDRGGVSRLESEFYTQYRRDKNV